MQFLGAIQRGLSQLDAGRLVGVSENTVRYHRKKFPAFDREYEASRLLAKADATECVTKAIKKNANIALAFLGRRYPNEWAHRKPDAIEPQKIAALLNQFIAHVFAVVPAEFHSAINANANALLMGVMSNQNEGKDEDDDG